VNARPTQILFLVCCAFAAFDLTTRADAQEVPTDAAGGCPIAARASTHSLQAENPH